MSATLFIPRTSLGLIMHPATFQPYRLSRVLYTKCHRLSHYLHKSPGNFRIRFYTQRIFFRNTNSKSSDYISQNNEHSIRIKENFAHIRAVNNSLQHDLQKCVALHFMLSAVLHCICRSLASKEKQSRAEKLALKILNKYRLIFYAPQLYLRSRFINLEYRYRVRRIESGLRETQTHVNG